MYVKQELHLLSHIPNPQQYFKMCFLALQPHAFLPIKAEPWTFLLGASSASNHFDLGFRRQAVAAAHVCRPLKVNLGPKSPKIILSLAPGHGSFFVLLREAWTLKVYK